MRVFILLVALSCLGGCAALQPRPPAPTTAQIVEWSREKVAPEVIIARLREADAVYHLSASALARLHDQGVADAVLDEIQAGQLRAVTRAALEHQVNPWGPWPGGYGPALPGRGWGPYPWGY